MVDVILTSVCHHISPFSYPPILILKYWYWYQRALEIPNTDTEPVTGSVLTSIKISFFHHIITIRAIMQYIFYWSAAVEVSLSLPSPLGTDHFIFQISSLLFWFKVSFYLLLPVIFSGLLLMVTLHITSTISCTILGYISIRTCDSPLEYHHKGPGFPSNEKRRHKVLKISFYHYLLAIFKWFSVLSLIWDNPVHIHPIVFWLCFFLIELLQ